MHDGSRGRGSGAVGRLALAAMALLAACGGGGGGGGGSGGGALLPENPWVVSPVAAYGQLMVCGAQICAADGVTPVQLRGMSLFWSNTGWGAEGYYNAELVEHLATQWNATVVRAAVGAQGGGDFTTDPTGNLARARAVIDAAIAQGMYVIVDWHSHGAGAADLTAMTAQAQAFFGALAEAYPNVPNLIWEPFNEPPGTAYGWAQVKAYHEAVIATIRGKGNTNLVVAGSPNWSQDVDVAARDPLADPDVAYTLHFYAHSHGAKLREKAEAALAAGRALFVTEWGDCDASGNGGFDPAATQEWLDWMDARAISSANWSMHSKPETASALVVADTRGPWREGELSDSGRLVLPYVHRGYAFELAVAKAGAGEGTVTSSPAGIDCGKSCATDFTRATTITLTATPAGATSMFAGWSGACSGAGACVVTMDAARSVTATFQPPAP